MRLFASKKSRYRERLRNSIRQLFQFEQLERRDLLAADFQLLKDINTTLSLTGSNPANFTDVSGTVFFTASTPTFGTELWKSDGTPAGTVMVKDIQLGNGSSAPSSLINLNGKLYFSANDGVTGAELWTSDGTAAGTLLVKDINPGTASSSPSSMLKSGSAIIFAADDGVHGRELWGSTGSSDITLLIKDINPGVGSSNPYSLFNTPFQIIFGANDGSTGIELWKTDGSANGTTLLTDINPGAASSSPSNFTLVNSTTYFTATNVTSGTELWSNQISTTTLLKDIRSGTGSSNPAYLVNVSGRLYFSANDGTNGTELWKSDLTTATTTLAFNVRSGIASSYPSNLTNFNGVVCFTADNGNVGRELWSYNSIFGGGLIKDINTNFTGSPGSSSPADLTVFNNSLYFSANDGSGRELWKSNGAASGTVVVSEINPSGSSYPTGIRNFNGTLYFSANDGTAGPEFWKSNGTNSSLIKDIASGTADSNPTNGVELNGSVLFSANNSTNGSELWKTDGTSAGTVLVKDIYNGTNSSSPSYLTNVNGVLFFAARDSTGYGLWKSDGSTNGTLLLKNFSRSPKFLTNVNGKLLFNANASDNSTGYELWKSDGTVGGTVLLKDINPSSASANPVFLTNVNGTLFFRAKSGANDDELWKSDSTSVGTVIVRDIRPGSAGSYPVYLTNTNGVLFFRANDGSNGYELWKSDGSSAGTVLVKDIRSGSVGSYPGYLTSVGGNIYFRANDGSNGYELWKSDGSANGTTLVKDIRPGSSSSSPRALINVNGGLFFGANDGSTGYELWKSDGTQAGTTLVKDLRPGIAFSNINGYSINGKLFFRSWDLGPNSGELWTSDGTDTGTVNIADLTGDTGSSFPSPFAILSGKMILSATTESYGRELYNDLTAPQILSVSPTLTSGVITGGDSGFSFNFTEPVFASSSNFALFVAGPDGLLGTLDDVSIPVAVSSPPGKQIWVSFAGLVQDSYRLTVKSGANGLKDIAGNQLDGDFNGTEGGDYVRDFVVDQPAVQVDDTFGSAGTVTTTFGNGADEAYGVIVQPDGKIVVVGGASNGTNVDMAIARYNANGSLDTSFDSDGRQLTAVGANDDIGFAVALQPDGKIVVAGGSSNGSNYDIAVVRYNTDGSLDTTFDTDGKVTTSIGSLNDFAYSLAVLSDGRIVVGGVSANATNYDFALVRYNPDGSRDQSFGVDGKVTTAIGTGSDVAQGLIVQSDGKYVLAGNSFNGTNFDFSFARYLPSGSLDTTFGSNGKTFVPIGSSDDGAYGLVQQPDGKIVAAGLSSNGTDNDMAVVRLNYNGTLDTTFNGNGKSVFPIGIAADEARSLALQSDGKIVVAGFTAVGTTTDFGIARLLSNGSLDSSFDGDGKLTMAVSNGFDSVVGIALQGDGGMVLAGFSSNATDIDFAVSRIQPTITSYSLSSVNGFTFDVDRSQQGSGQLLQGGAANIYDGVNRLRIGSVEFAPTNSTLGSTDDGGRTWMSGVFSVSGLNVTREITVPATGTQDFSRQLEVFQNTTSSTIATSVTLASNFGSNANSTIFATSDGDTLVEPTDWWIGIDDADANGGIPAVIQILRGPFPDNLASVTNSQDSLGWTFNLTIAPGETKRIATFTVVGATRQQAIDSANALLSSSGLQGQSTAFLSQPEINSIANMHFNVAPTDISLSASSINENNNANAVVATLTSVDDNAIEGDTFTYSLISGAGSDDNASFAISGNQLLATSQFDFETKNAYTIRLRTVDRSGLPFDKQVTIAILNVPEPATVSVTSSNSVAYNSDGYVATGSVTGPNGPVNSPSLTYTYYVGGDTSGTNLGSVAPKNVGVYTVIATYGGDANYLLSSSPAFVFNITPKTLTSTASAANRVYNANTTASVTISLVGVFSGDTVTGSASGSFADKNVGTGKTVTVGTVALAGADADNYTVSAPTSPTADITAFGLTSTASAANRVYNANTTASVTISLVGVFSGDTVTGSASGSFADKNVGTGKTVTVGTVALAGADAGNYTVSAPTSPTADITAFGLTSTASAANRVYNANTSASVTISLVGVFSGDTVTGSASGSFADKNVGTGKTVTVGTVALAGADAGNYTVSAPTSPTADITAFGLIGSITAANKPYDGTTAAAILSRTLVTVFSGDTVSYVGGTAQFDNANVGSSKTVTATGLSMTGTDAGNYTVNESATTTADIKNVNPVLTRDSAAVSGNEGTTITNTGTWSDPGDTVTLSASVGTVVKNNDGTWAWSIAVPNNVPSTTVTITATDSNGGSNQLTFTYTALNVAPMLTRDKASVIGNVLTTITNTGTYGDVPADKVALSADFGTIVDNGNGTWFWSITLSAAIINQTVTVTGSDEDGGQSTVTFMLTANSTISTRSLFYANATGTSASTSLATDKVPLLPGQSSTFANYTNYSRGLNGLVIDVVGLPATVTDAQLAASLQYANWDGIAAAGFVALPGAAVPTVAIVNGGVAGATRVRVTFPDNTLQNTWLRVTVVANADTRLAANDVFYFGNVIGDFNVGNTATRIRVNALDTSAVRNNQSPGANSAGVANIYDVNRDGRVNALDTSIVRNNQQTSGIVAPITAPSAFGRSGSGALGGQGGTNQGDAGQRGVSQGGAMAGAAASGNGQMPSSIPDSQSFAAGSAKLIPAIGSRLTSENYDVPRSDLVSVGNASTEAISDPSIAEKAILPEVSINTKKKRSEGETAVSQLDTYFACLALELEGAVFG
jgi:trimeric autotransporter adhesin